VGNYALGEMALDKRARWILVVFSIDVMYDVYETRREIKFVFRDAGICMFMRNASNRADYGGMVLYLVWREKERSIFHQASNDR